MVMSALSMSYDDVMNGRRPAVAAVPPAPTNRTPPKPEPIPSTAAPRPAPAPALRTGGFYAEANRALAQPFNRVDVPRVDFFDGAEPQRRGLQQPTLNTARQAIRPAVSDAYPDETLRGAIQGGREAYRQGLIGRIPLETDPVQGVQATPRAPRSAPVDNYTNSPERSAWQQQMLARQPNRVDPLEWQARTRAEALAAPQGEVFRPGGTVSTLSGPSTDELLARADRIRAIRESSTPLRDELAFNTGAVGGRQYSQDERIQGLLAGPSRSGRAEALRFLGQREAGAGEAARERARAESLSALESARGENQLASTRLQGENALAAARLSAETGAPLREAQAELARVQARAAEAGIDRVNPLAPPTIDPKVMESLAATDPAAAREYYESQVSMQQQRQVALRALNLARADGLTREQILSDPRLAAAYSLVYEPQRFAEGGLVRGIGQTPDAAQVMPEVTEYRDYTQGAQALGLPAIPFEQFLTLRRGAKQVAQAPGPVQPFSAMGFAMGGEIPSPNDVSGKMVLDLNPSAQTDSIPAMIDGQMPAALDHGEFVFPRFAVQFYGTDRINKMIEAAKQGSAKTQE